MAVVGSDRILAIGACVVGVICVRVTRPGPRVGGPTEESTGRMHTAPILPHGSPAQGRASRRGSSAGGALLNGDSIQEQKPDLAQCAVTADQGTEKAQGHSRVGFGSEGKCHAGCRHAHCVSTLFRSYRLRWGHPDM